ncbi:MAG: hypothetical protein DRI34_00740 [Deltaproteobacteria bacterium]|nr:MAG: hypothetical protein DRI34_00740 [Deltaproteobacteria bacterium]
MKYLYGDLTEFPAQEDTLQLLRDMVDMSVKVLGLDEQIENLREQMQSRREWLAAFMEEIDAFKQDLLGYIERSAANRQEQQKTLLAIAHSCSNQVNRAIKQGKAEVIAEAERVLADLQARLQAQQQACRQAFQQFFRPALLPLQANRLHCLLDDSAYRVSVEITDVAGICCTYAVDASAVEMFSQPRRFADILPGKHEIPVGLKKAWLKREPVAHSQRLDDTLLAEINDSDERVSMRFIRRQAASGDGLLVRMSKNDPQSVELFRIDDSGQPEPVDRQLLGPEHIDTLQLLWQQLQPSLLALYRCGGTLSTVSLDGRDVLDKQLVPELVKRLVHFLAPTIREIDARSPSPLELCLKLEHESGRREELYVSKKELAEKICRLSTSRRALFTPLGIDPNLGEPTGEDPLDDGPTLPDSG